jgi:hypothetical protein
MQDFCISLFDSLYITSLLCIWYLRPCHIYLINHFLPDVRNYSVFKTWSPNVLDQLTSHIYDIWKCFEFVIRWIGNVLLINEAKDLGRISFWSFIDNREIIFFFYFVLCLQTRIIQINGFYCDISVHAHIVLW